MPQMWVAPFESLDGGGRRIVPDLQRPGGRWRLAKKAALWPVRQKYALLALLGVPVVLVVLVWGYRAVLREPASVQAYLIDLRDEFRKPAKRLLSWIELDLTRSKETDASEYKPPVVEFPDIGLQVMRSRRGIEDASCRFVPATPSVDPWLALIPDLGSGMIKSSQSLLLAMDDLLGQVCPAGTDAETVVVTDLALPEIQNDFIAAWIVHALGRDGAFALALLQFTLVCLMITAAFRVMRWRSGDEDRRAASTFLAGAIVGFAVTLFLQFSIAWMNAFGLLPVMGQPMTFVSHGGSHFLLFGIPAMLSVMTGLRFMRSEAPRGFAATLSPIPKRFRSVLPVRRRPAR
jgi:hypothetical protein